MYGQRQHDTPIPESMPSFYELQWECHATYHTKRIVTERFLVVYVTKIESCATLIARLSMVAPHFFPLKIPPSLGANQIFRNI